MKTKQLMLTLGTVVLAGSLMLTSCRKKTKEQEDPDSDQTEASENNIAENMMNDVSGIGSQGSENGSLSTYRYDPAGALGPFGTTASTITLGVKTFTVDFGPLPGSLCLDGRVRSGKLMFDYSMSTNTIMPIYYRTPGFKCSITTTSLSPYVVDGYTVNIINKTIENTTPLASVSPTLTAGAMLTWSVSANVSIIKPSGGGTISWVCNRTKTLLNTNDPICYGGQTVPINWTKAKIKLDGSASGTTASGNNYTSSIIALVRDFGGCKIANKYPFISGDIQFTPGTKATRYINFGSGTCDNSGTITIKGITYTFNF